MFKLPRSGLVQPLINLPFCPDNTIIVGFSGSFARCPLSAISGHHYGSLICLTRQKVNSQNSSIKSDRYSVCRTTPLTPSDLTWTGSCGLFISTACGPVRTSSPPIVQESAWGLFLQPQTLKSTGGA